MRSNSLGLVNTVGPFTPFHGARCAAWPRSSLGFATAPEERPVVEVLGLGLNIGRRRLHHRVTVGIFAQLTAT